MSYTLNILVRPNKEILLPQFPNTFFPKNLENLRERNVTQKILNNFGKIQETKLSSILNLVRHYFHLRLGVLFYSF